MKIKKGLGRGLSALIPQADMDFLSQVARGEGPIATPPPQTHDTVAVDAARSLTRSSAEVLPNTESTDESRSAIQWVAVEAIVANPFQPRRHFDEAELQELAESVGERGVLQPVLLRPVGDAAPSDPRVQYQLIAGERRWRAASAAGLRQVPAIVHRVGDQQALELALIENTQRRDVSAIDTAISYKRLCVEFNLSQEQVARRVGRSRSGVANTMRLLDLPEEVTRAIETGELSEGHGRAILLASSEGARRALFKRVLRDKLSVREAERLAQQGNRAESGVSPPAAGATAVSLAERRDLQFKLQKRLGARVTISGTGRGRLSIRYATLEEFDRLCKILLAE